MTSHRTETVDTPYCGYTVLRVLMVFGALMVLTSCGYSLRSNDVLTSKFDTLNLSLAQPNGEMAQLLRRNLEIAAVNVDSDSSNDATPVLHLGAEQLLARPITVNPQARAAQYELTVAVTASLTRGTEILMAPETLQIQRNYFEDIENIAGNQTEMALIASEMRRELINQLLRRLEATQL